MEDTVQGVIDTIDAVSLHRIQLTDLLDAIHQAKSQIGTSSVKSCHELNEHFTRLKSEMHRLLDERQRQLEAEVKQIEEEAILPIVQCEDLVRQGITMAKEVMDEGRQLLSGNHEEHKSAMDQFKLKINEFGLDRLPEVPSLSDVSCIHVDLPESPDIQRTRKAIQRHGKVLSRAPVQISNIQQRPGALMVKWIEVEEESWLDLNEYRLQYAPSTTTDTDVLAFSEAYQGSNTCYVVRHLQPMHTYTFRVCGRAEGATSWSPWSVAHTAVTTMTHYEWNKDQADYELSIKNSAAQKIKSDTDTILFSNANSYVCGHTIIFKILDTGREGDGMDGIALLATTTNPKSLLRSNTIFVSCQGNVYIDGKEKPTKLPALTRGSVLIFDTVVLQSDKVRVTIEVNERIVTFDWTPQDTQKSNVASALSGAMGAAQKEQNLYFAMKFCHKDWKISVE